MEYNEDYFEIKQKLQKLYLKSTIVAGLGNIKLGTLLRHLSNKIGKSFKNDEIGPYTDFKSWSDDQFGDVEILILEGMKKLGKGFGLNSSLHDVPNIFAKSTGAFTQKALFYPLYTITTGKKSRFYPKLVSIFGFTKNH